ncbi:hypothetical protein D3C79_1065540 [compost metagenome]
MKVEHHLLKLLSVAKDVMLNHAHQYSMKHHYHQFHYYLELELQEFALGLLELKSQPFHLNVCGQ